MRRVVLTLFLCGLAACGERLPADFVLREVNIVDVEAGQILPKQDVAVLGNRITGITPAASNQEYLAAVEVDASGQYLIPGLWDMHAHTYADAEARTAFLPAFVAHGVTGIREMFADCYEACAGSDGLSVTKLMEIRHPPASMVQAWSDDVAAGKLVGPRIVRSSYVIAGAVENAWPSSRVVEGIADARDAVLQSAERDVDFIKIYDDLGRDEFFEIARVADSLSLPVAGHVPLSVTPEEASEAGMDSFEHLLRLASYCVRDPGEAGPGAEDWNGAERLRNLASPQECLGTFSTMARNGTHIVPTLVVLGAYANIRALSDPADPRRRYLPAHILELWDSRSRDEALTDAVLAYLDAIHDAAAALVPVAHGAGVQVLAGSDTPNPYVYPGSGLHDELEELVRAGLSPLDALRAATLNPARYFDALDSLGTVEAGKLADLVLLEANPLDEIGNTRRIEAVIANGRLFDRARLDDVLASIQDHAEDMK